MGMEVRWPYMLYRGQTYLYRLRQLLPVTPEMRMAMGGGISASNERITKGLDGVAFDAG